MEQKLIRYNNKDYKYMRMFSPSVIKSELRLFKDFDFILKCGNSTIETYVVDTQYKKARKIMKADWKKLYGK